MTPRPSTFVVTVAAFGLSACAGSTAAPGARPPAASASDDREARADVEAADEARRQGAFLERVEAWRAVRFPGTATAAGSRGTLGKPGSSRQ